MSDYTPSMSSTPEGSQPDPNDYPIVDSLRRLCIGSWHLYQVAVSRSTYPDKSYIEKWVTTGKFACDCANPTPTE